jgi:hypothetical protein
MAPIHIIIIITTQATWPPSTSSSLLTHPSHMAPIHIIITSRSPKPHGPIHIIILYVINHSFPWHVQNATIPCCSQKLLPFLSVMYFFLPLFPSIHSHLILPSISWSTSQSFSKIHI